VPLTHGAHFVEIRPELPRRAHQEAAHRPRRPRR